MKKYYLITEAAESNPVAVIAEGEDFDTRLQQAINEHFDAEVSYTLDTKAARSGAEHYGRLETFTISFNRDDDGESFDDDLALQRVWMY